MIDFYKEHWEAKQIISATELESYFESIKNELIGKSIDSIINTGILFGESSWDEEKVYKNGKWYERETNIETIPPQYYPWKDEGVTLFFDQPIIFNFGETRLEIEYTFGSLVKVATNSIDTNNVRFYSDTPDISKHFSKKIIGHRLVDIRIHKTNHVYFMNFSHLNIERNEGDDMFEEIWFIFDNGYVLELTTDHCDYTILNELSSMPKSDITKNNKFIGV